MLQRFGNPQYYNYAVYRGGHTSTQPASGPQPTASNIVQLRSVIQTQPMSSNMVQPCTVIQSQQIQPTPTGSTFPPVLAHLHHQIIQGEYVDFNSLLAKTLFVENAGEPSSSQQPARKAVSISSFASWMEARNIYLSIMLNHNPVQALELVGYQCLISSANKLLPIDAWLQYKKFRTLAASNLSLCWDQRHPDL